MAKFGDRQKRAGRDALPHGEDDEVCPGEVWEKMDKRMYALRNFGKVEIETGQLSREEQNEEML